MHEQYSEQVEALAKRYQDAEGLVIKMANYAGSQVENILPEIPEGFEKQLETIVQGALDAAYTTSEALSTTPFTPETPTYFHKAAVTFAGAIGGLTGLPGALAELPVTITTMFSSIQKIAGEYEFDQTHPETKLECIKVFSMGGPLDTDDELDLSFVSLRLGLQGELVTQLISKVAQKMSLIISQKLWSQAIPFVGAITGASLNFAFMSYYEEMAHVRFGLKKLQKEYPDKDPLTDFKQLISDKTTPQENLNTA